MVKGIRSPVLLTQCHALYLKTTKPSLISFFQGSLAFTIARNQNKKKFYPESNPKPLQRQFGTLPLDYEALLQLGLSKLLMIYFSI